jgi:hypothetical protein
MSVLQKLRELFPDHKAGKRWFNIHCPFCQEHGHKPDRKYHLGINYQYGYIHCFRCRTRHKLTYFLKILRKDFDSDDFTFEETHITVSHKTEIEFPKEYLNVLDLFDARYSNYVKALEYIDRRIGIELALKINVGFCNIGRYANRIIVPVFDSCDNIVYFVARAIYGFIEPKILNPLGERKSVLFNWNNAKKFSEIYLMEGVFGALTVFPYGIATLGKEITEEQIFVILRSKVKIVNIVLDGNAIKDAYSVADKIADLTSKVKVRVLKLKKETQPDDFNFEHLIRLKGHSPFYKRIF